MGACAVRLGRTAFSEQARILADRTNDAYSWDAYGPKQWLALVRLLLKKGYTEREVEAIVRSKHTRWSRDRAGRYRGLARDFAAYYTAQEPGYWLTEVPALVEGTFGGE